MNYYNDNDKHSAAWLRELVKQGHLPPGDVDDRSIKDVRPEDLKDYTQCHFFAGIGGWPLALRLAGWPTDRHVWTGSCPCQPFSSAGQGKGTDDPRHLWPDFCALIAQCNPPVVFGEQVASKAGRLWFSGVRTDLEALGYGVGAADLCAAGLGAPHIRQRLWWVAHATGSGQQTRGAQSSARGEGLRGADKSGSGVADAQHDGHDRPQGTKAEQNGNGQDGGLHRGSAGGSRVGDSTHAEGTRQRQQPEHVSGQTTHPAWEDAIAIPCADGKARRIKPGLAPLVNGLPGRVGLLRGYGNAIVPQVAAEFISAYLEVF